MTRLDSVTRQTTWALDNPSLVGLTIARAEHVISGGRRVRFSVNEATEVTR